jgi:hypothetical protein
VKKYSLVPALAADLVRQLDGHPPAPELADQVRKVQALYKFQPIAADTFESMLRLVARGASVRCRRTRVSVAGSDISPAVLGRYLAEPALRSRFEDARQHWRTYREFGVLEVEELLEELARGEKTLQAIVYGRGWNLKRYRHLLRLIARTPAITQRYHQAKLSQHARISARLFEEVAIISTREEGRAICRRMHLARIRMPKAIRKVCRPERSPLEQARRRAGLRVNGQRKEKP